MSRMGYDEDDFLNGLKDITNVGDSYSGSDTTDITGDITVDGNGNLTSPSSTTTATLMTPAQIKAQTKAVQAQTKLQQQQLKQQQKLQKQQQAMQLKLQKQQMAAQVKAAQQQMKLQMQAMKLGIPYTGTTSINTLQPLVPQYNNTNQQVFNPSYPLSYQNFPGMQQGYQFPGQWQQYYSSPTVGAQPIAGYGMQQPYTYPTQYPTTAPVNPYAYPQPGVTYYFDPSQVLAYTNFPGISQGAQFPGNWQGYYSTPTAGATPINPTATPQYPIAPGTPGSEPLGVQVDQYGRPLQQSYYSQPSFAPLPGATPGYDPTAQTGYSDYYANYNSGGYGQVPSTVQLVQGEGAMMDSIMGGGGGDVYDTIPSDAVMMGLGYMGDDPIANIKTQDDFMKFVQQQGLQTSAASYQALLNKLSGQGTISPTDKASLEAMIKNLQSGQKPQGGMSKTTEELLIGIGVLAVGGAVVYAMTRKRKR